MTTTFFGFALADSMIPDTATISKKPLSIDEVKQMVNAGVVSVCNSSHTATVEALTQRFGIQVQIPEKPPSVTVESGNKLVVMGVRGLPRLTDRHHYTAEEIANATFKFSLYEVK